MPIIPYTQLPDLPPLQDVNAGPTGSEKDRPARLPATPAQKPFSITDLKEMFKALGFIVRPGILDSSDFETGISGFRVSSDLIEAMNLRARGLLQTANFQKATISSIGGNIQLNKGSDTLGVDMTALDASTLTIKGTETFAVGDFLRIKEGSDDEWFEITNIASAPTYTVTRDKAAAYAADTNPAWKKGATVVNYGVSGQGFIEMQTAVTNSPWIKIATHAGAPWSTLDTKVLIGQLKDKTGSDEYGIWIKSGAAYIGGFRIFEAIVDAAGDGDYTNIQAALDAGKKRIFVRKGTYTLSANITSSADDVIIEGESNTETIIDGINIYYISMTGARVILKNFLVKRGPTNYCIYFASSYGQILNIRHEKAVGSTSQRGFHVASGGSYAKIEGCYSDAAVWPVYILGAYTACINNIFEGGDGGECYIGNNYVNFSNNICSRTGNVNEAGVKASPALYCIIQGNKVTNTAKSADTGISVSADTLVLNNQIIGFKTGIYIDDFRNVVSGNYLYDTATNGIEVSGSTTTGEGHNIVSNNVIKDGDGNGIFISFGHKCVITGNTIYSVTGDGITKYNAVAGLFIVTDNVIANCGGDAIDLVQGAYSLTYCIINNNMLYSNTGVGIKFTGSYSNIMGNMSQSNGTAYTITNTSGNTVYNL